MPKQPHSKKNQPKKSRAGAGGPRTAAGKENSRYNAVKHGLQAGQLVLILADESVEQYEALRAGWLAAFDPETFGEKTLVDELIRAHWLFQRAQRRLMEAERAMAGDDNVHPVDWPAEDEHKIELLQRYKTSHERSYYRALSTVRQFWKDRLDNEIKLRKMARELEERKQEKRELEAQGRELKRELERFEEPEARERDSDADEAKRDGAKETLCGASEKAFQFEKYASERIFRVRGADEAGRLVRLEEWVPQIE